MISLKQWTWVRATSGRYWRIGKPGVLRFMGRKEWDMTYWLNNNETYKLCPWVLHYFENMFFHLSKCTKLPREHFGRYLVSVKSVPESIKGQSTPQLVSDQQWYDPYIIPPAFILLYLSSLRICVAVFSGFWTILSLDLYSGNRLSWYRSTKLLFEKLLSWTWMVDGRSIKK